jgi:hypothetical protein
MSVNLSTVIAGTTLPLKATEVMKKDETNPLGPKVGTGKFWHTLRKETGPVQFGVKVPALDAQLPTSIEIDGHTVDLTIAMQDASYTNRMTKKVVVRKERHLQATADGTFTSPTLGEVRAYGVTITDTGDDVWNIKITVNRGNGGGGTVSPVSKQASAAATLAAFLAE